MLISAFRFYSRLSLSVSNFCPFSLSLGVLLLSRLRGAHMAWLAATNPLPFIHGFILLGEEFWIFIPNSSIKIVQSSLIKHETRLQLTWGWGTFCYNIWKKEVARSHSHFLALLSLTFVPTVARIMYHQWNSNIFSTDLDQHGVLRADPAGQNNPKARIRRASSLREATPQGQVLELRVLQIHFRVRRAERAVYGRGCTLVGLVHRAWLSKSPQSTLQRSIRIRK